MSKQICIFSVALIFAILLASCSDSEDQETSALEEQQHQMAEQLVENINEPLDKANLANEISEDHNRRLKEAIEEQ